MTPAGFGFRIPVSLLAHFGKGDADAEYAQEAMDFFQAFANSPKQLQEEDQKLKFLDSVCTLCRVAKDDAFSQDLDVFCHRYKLGEMIQVLLYYLFFDTVAVQERAMSRVRLLSHLLAESSTVHAGQNEDSGAACGQIQIPVLGKMLDHLFFKLFRKEETSLISLDILCSLFTFLSK
ncbi:hypothetical protein HGM15179_019422 [Zosterops borbonicus]|uniref:Uncharacterized protein n=1 Tax=Zosterops borbonicus TaxID=364589 RepID=A0A8K1D9D8_9PASS|nr:hypothetical protein HGM15179_019422 [Zosterops borbonicus]